MPSVVIPAHNESATLARLLDRITRTMRPGEFEIVVACNGCTDDTASIARTFPVTVVELSEASKIAALNAGDRSVQSFPRAYVDADVVVDAEALRVTFAALANGPALCAAPRLIVNTAHSPLLVRAAVGAWQHTEWQSNAAVGSGMYALSKAGHARVSPFPEVIADDAYVTNAFTAQERTRLEHVTFTAFAPKTLRGFFARRQRVYAGNNELSRIIARQGSPSPSPEVLRMLTTVLRYPEHVVGFVMLLASRIVAALSRPPEHWVRDNSSRTAVNHPSRTRASRLRNGLRSYADPRVYFHLFRLLHFVGYTHTRERRHVAFGRNVRFSPTVSLRNGMRIRIGDDSAIGEFSALWAGDTHSTISIGNRTLFGPGVICTASDYGLALGVPFRHQQKHEADIVIGNDVWLGARVIVTRGIVIGDGAVVGAGAVVTRSLPPNCIAVGVPARVIAVRTASDLLTTEESEPTYAM
ncbi:MAG: glycosyltransferase [Acidimicrobiia bacterium]